MGKDAFNGLGPMGYLKRNTWSRLDMEDFELDALHSMLMRVDPTTVAEQVMWDRVNDSVIRREAHKQQFPEEWPS